MAVVRRRKPTDPGRWDWRFFGFVLCAFFGFGVFAGLNGSNRDLYARLNLSEYQRQLLSALNALAQHHQSSSFTSESARSGPIDDPSVLVERKDGFYSLLADGSLRGPISVGAAADFPVLSGPGLDNVSPDRMLEYAGKLVRAEAALSAMVSEMRVAEDGTFSLFLEHSRAELIFDRDNWTLELDRAVELLRRWRGRENLIASIDMTTPGQAVIQLRTELVTARAHDSTPVALRLVRNSADRAKGPLAR